MSTVIITLCCISGYVISKPLINALRARDQARKQSHARALRAFINAKRR